MTWEDNKVSFGPLRVVETLHVSGGETTVLITIPQELHSHYMASIHACSLHRQLEARECTICIASLGVFGEGELQDAARPSVVGVHGKLCFQSLQRRNET